MDNNNRIIGPIKGPTNSNSLKQRNIFRSTALQHYRQNQERIDYPRFATPRIVTLLWILSAILISIGGAIGVRFFLPLGL